MGAQRLRVIDFGTVSPIRSQTLWHAVASGVSAGSPPTLSFCRPAGAYVSLGYHRAYSEVDDAACTERGLPVFRRMVGGGPVYLDPGQHFFQITVPRSLTTGSYRATMRRLLAPAVAAFRACGIAAEMDEEGEIVVGDRKICGHAAGQIGDAVVVVGNLITTFDHEAAAATLRVPLESIRPELVRLMQRYVAATPADADVFRSRATEAYAAALECNAEQGALDDVEAAALDEYDERFADPAWVRGDGAAPAEPWRVKIKSGVRMFSAAARRDRVILSIGSGKVLRAFVASASLNGTAAELAGALQGVGVGEVAAVLQDSPAPELALLVAGVDQAGR